MNATLSVISGRALLYTLGVLIIAGAIFWGCWKLIQLIPNPTLKTAAWVVWVVLLVVFVVDFLFGFVGIVSAPVLRY